MRLLYLAFYLWRSAAAIVTVMLALLWCTSKVRILSWLGASRKRWLWLWSLFGLLIVLVIVSAAQAISDDDSELFIRLSEWSPLHFYRPDRIGIAVLALAVSIKLSVKFLALAAISWWFFRWVSTTLRTHEKTSTRQRLGMSMFFSAYVFSFLNDLIFRRTVTSSDFSSPCGVPFTFYHEGGFAGGTGFVWEGVLEDSLVVLAFGIVLAFLWKWVSRHQERPKGLSDHVDLQAP